MIDLTICSRSRVTCADALEEAVRHHGGEARSRQIFDYINKHYPDRWKDNTIRCHIMGCTVNHSSSHWYKHFRKFLYHLGPGHVRLYDPEKDGKWIWTAEGMVKVDTDEEGRIEPDPVEDDDENRDGVDIGKISLSLERDLELFLYNDLGSLELDLNLPGDNGSQIKVDRGRLDILAKDKDGAYVVIELKAGTAKDQALTQLLDYMGVIAEKYDSNVRGILVAHSFNDRLIRASRMVPSIKLMKYKVHFSFESI